MKKATALTVAALILGAVAAPASHAAQPWPSQPIRLIVPYPPGGSVDNLARLLAPSLGQRLGQTIVIENKAGASGTIGVDATVRATPDGSTFGFGVPGAITGLPHVMKVPYEVSKIQYVSLVARIPQVIMVNPSLPDATLADFVASAKKQPGKYNYGSAGNVTTPHLGGELLKQQHWMRCPKCGHELAEQELSGIKVDRCPNCGGVFFDAGELDTLLESQEPAGFLGGLKRLMKR